MTMPTAADGALVARLGWTLVHFLWQGALIGLVTASLLAGLRAARAQTRHVAACAGLSAMLVVPVLTFFIVTPEKSVLAGASAGTRVMTAAVDRSVTIQVPPRLESRDAARAVDAATAAAVSGTGETPLMRRARYSR